MIEASAPVILVMSRNMARGQGSAALRACGSTCNTYIPQVDRLDTCGEVKSGLGTVTCVTLVIVLAAVPLLLLGGMPWVRSWEGSGVCLQSFRDILGDAGVGPRSACVDYAFHGLNYSALKEDGDMSSFLVELVQRVLSERVPGGAERVEVRLIPGPRGALEGTIARCALPGRLQTPNEVASARAATESLLEAQARSRLERAGSASLVLGQGLTVRGGKPVLAPDPTEAGKAFDEDADGVVSWGEFRAVMRRTAYSDATQMRVVFGGLDLDMDGVLERGELEDAIAAATEPSDCWPPRRVEPTASTRARSIPTAVGSTTTTTHATASTSTSESTTHLLATTTAHVEASAFMPSELRSAMARAGLIPTVGSVTYTVNGLSYQVLKNNAKIWSAVERFAQHAVSDSLSGDASPEEVEVTLTEGKNGGETSTDIRCSMPVRNASKLAQLSELSVQIQRMLADDVSARCQAALLTDEAGPSPSVGRIEVEGGVASRRVNESAYGSAFDRGGDGTITWGEFQSVTRDIHIGGGARAAFARLDADSDGILRPSEVQEILAPERAVPSHRPRPAARRTAPATAPATTTTEVPAAAPTEAPNVVLLRMDLWSTAWDSLEAWPKEQLADAFREKLAFLMGSIPAEEVMDPLGKPGCVAVWKASSPRGAMQRRLRQGGHLALLGCVAMPVEANLEAVEKLSPILARNAIADFGRKAGVHVAPRDVFVSVEGRASCSTPATSDREQQSFCKDAPTPRATTTSTRTETLPPLPPRQRGQVTTLRPEGELPSMANFLKQLGVTARCDSAEAFAAIDPNGDRASYLSELADAAAGFEPPYRETQIANLFDWLDGNKDGRIEASEFMGPCERARAQEAARAKEGLVGAIPLSLYRKSLGHPTDYRKVGVGLCRTAAEAWPHSTEHPEARTKAFCRDLCEGSGACGAYAFRSGGTCRLYPGSKEYTGTTASLDVECFAKVYSTRALFDMATVKWAFHGVDLKGVTEEEQDRISQRLASAVSSEVSIDQGMVRDQAGTSGKCSLMPGAQHGSTSSQASCFIDSANLGGRIHELRAAFQFAATRQRLADLVASAPCMTSLSADTLQVDVAGSSTLFRAADVNRDGLVVLDEFLRSATARRVPLTEESARFAFQGLDQAGDGALSPDEFEADGLVQWSNAPLQS